MLNGVIEVDVADDRMEAYVRFMEDKEDWSKNEPIDYNSVVEALRRNRVVFGLKEDVIREALVENTYKKYYCVAEGIKPIDGADARIEYKHNMEQSLKPRLDSEGNIDYLNVNNYISVQEGDIIAVYVPPRKSVTGCNVFGRTVRGNDGKNIRIPLGKNVGLLRDKVTIAAKVSGLLQILDGALAVMPVLKINSDVDVVTGNINFAGSVQVRGNVCAGMTIKAKGSVEINGIIETAVIEADGDVIINGGIKGMDKAIITSGGNIVARYIENAVVSAKGNITSDMIIQSRVEAEGEVHATGTTGVIRGGFVKSSKGIICRTLGSDQNIATDVEVGTQSVNKSNLRALETKISALKRELDRMNSVIDSGLPAITNAQVKALDEILEKKPMLENELMTVETACDQLRELIETNKNASVTVIDDAYVKVSITINHIKYFINSPYYATTFYTTGNIIRMRPSREVNK